MRVPSVRLLQRQAQAQRSRGHYQLAEESLEKAVRVAAASLADLHGTLGGTLRDHGRWAAAVRNYDRGYRLEQRYGIASSYNRLNRLLTRVLSQGAVRDRVDVDRELRTLLAFLLEATVRGTSDFWAAGDLALTAALAGDGRAMNKGLALFATSATPAWAYDAYLKTVAQVIGVRRPQARQLKMLQRRLLRAKATR